MKKKWNIAIVIIAIVCIGYCVVQFLGNPSLDITTGSASEVESRSDGFYIGTYVPALRQVSLKDHSIVHVPDAWAEHAWKPEFTRLLQTKKITASGYYLYIPIHWDQSIGANRAWPFKFSLELDQQGHQISRYPGMSYDQKVGFTVFLDSLPNTIEFTVQQKLHDNDSWDNAVRVGSIEFKRTF